MTAVVKPQRHLPKAHHDVYQQATAGMTPKSSWLRVRDVEAVRVKEDALIVVLFFRCLSHTPPQDHRCSAGEEVACSVISQRRRGTGRSWRVAASCRRRGKSARRTGPREVRLGNIARHVWPWVSCFPAATRQSLRQPFGV